MTWKAGLYGVLSLTAVRMLPVAVAFPGTHARRPMVAFAGWFGPRGLASIVFTVIVLDEAMLPNISVITGPLVPARVQSLRLRLHPTEGCPGEDVALPAAYDTIDW